ncbi:MAG: flippase-like domain-containing protein [Firmicutes bacterium]|nr:flippase-like domain-containing protein [Bacillota bacterium]
MKRNILNFIIIVVVVILTFNALTSNGNLYELKTVVKRIEPLYITLGILIMIIFWILDGAVLYNLTKMIHLDGNYFKSLKTTMIGQYYISITPFASGGPPSLYYSMKRNGLKIGEISSILTVKFIINELVLAFFLIIGLIFNISFLYRDVTIAFPFVMFGIILRISVIIFIALTFSNSVITKKVLFKILNILNRIKPIKNIEKYKIKLNNNIDEYLKGTNKIKNNKIKSLKIAILCFLKLLSYFSVTYIVYIALGFNEVSFLKMVFLQPLLHIAISYIPIPGKAGASEAGFYLLFKTFFTPEMLAYAVLIWRGLTFYFKIIVCGGVVLIDKIKG